MRKGRMVSCHEAHKGPSRLVPLPREVEPMLLAGMDPALPESHRAGSVESWGRRGSGRWPRMKSLHDEQVCTCLAPAHAVCSPYGSSLESSAERSRRTLAGPRVSTNNRRHTHLFHGRIRLQYASSVATPSSQAGRPTRFHDGPAMLPFGFPRACQSSTTTS